MSANGREWKSNGRKIDSLNYKIKIILKNKDIARYIISSFSTFIQTGALPWCYKQFLYGFII